MPLYEYECKSCGNRFEKIQKFSDPLVKDCPKCGKDTVEQMISAPSFQFKGAGWYVNDYAGKKSGGNSKGDSSSGGESGGGSAKSDSGASESKSESTSESKPAKDTKPTSTESK